MRHAGIKDTFLAYITPPNLSKYEYRFTKKVGYRFFSIYSKLQDVMPSRKGEGKS